MDDEKKEKKAPPGKTAEEVVIIVLILFLVAVAFSRIFDFFTPGGSGESDSGSYIQTITGGPNGWLATFLHYVNVTVSVYVTVATIFSIVTFLAILYVAWLTYQLSVEEKKRNVMSPIVAELPSLQTQKWHQVLAHVNSHNPAEWRLAILEADVLLDDLVQSKGFYGETLGDRLKNVSKGDFKTLDAAWEAHKIRNAIAHEGSDFLLSQRESKRVVDLYGTVFKEFSYV